MLLYTFVFVCIFIKCVFGSPVEVTLNSFIESGSTEESQSLTDKYSECVEKVLDIEDVTFLDNGHLFVRYINVTVSPSNLSITINDSQICFQTTYDLNREILKRCFTFIYQKDEFQSFPNGSVLFFGQWLENGTFEVISDGSLLLCDFDHDDDYNGNYNDTDDSDYNPLSTKEKISFYIGIIGSSISVLALLAHSIIFCLVPTLWNLPGYNLLSLSIAFLMAYSFVLIGQVPQVLGICCVLSAILQQYFFLASFFCMNVMAFDVWRTLKMATERLLLSTESSRRLRFFGYSFYIWCAPLCIVATSVIVDNTDNFSDSIKPMYGRMNKCWINNSKAKAIFFTFPAFALFLANAIFFTLSALILKNSTMKDAGNQYRQTARVNFILYVRLAFMLGFTWLIGGVAILSQNIVVWFFFDLFNSLQGLFVFLLFTCSRKVFNHVRDRMSFKMVTEKSSSVSTKTESSKSKICNGPVYMNTSEL